MALLEQLGINGTLIAAILQFILLLVLLKAVAYKPIMKMMDDRKTNIETSLANAETQVREAQKLHAEQVSAIQKAKGEAQDIIQRATKISEERAREIYEEAQAESARLKKSALDDIEIEKKKALIAIRGEVTTLALLAAGKVLGKAITGQDQEDMVKDFIAKVDQLQ